MIIPFIILICAFIFNIFASNGWQWQNPWPTGIHLFDVWVLNDSTIIIDGYGGAILRTENEGETREEILFDDYELIIGLMFINDDMGFVFGKYRQVDTISQEIF